MNQTVNFSDFQKTLANEFFVSLLLSTILEYIMLFGIVGNVISLFIFSRPCLNSKTNSGKLYAFLCCISLIVIIYEMADRKLESFFSIKIRLHLNTENFINTVLLQYLSWIQVLITFDRFIGVFYPIKGVRIMGKKWVLYSIMFGLLLLILGVNSPNYIRCSSYMMCNDIIFLTDIVRILMQFVIPYLIMVIVDVKVIIRIRKSKNRLAARQSTNNNKSSRFTRNTILIDFIYLFFKFPPTIYSIYNLLFMIFRVLPQVPSQYLFILSPIFKHFSHIYYSLLFLLFLIFNSIFRSEFISLFRLDKCFLAIKNRFF